MDKESLEKGIKLFNEKKYAESAHYLLRCQDSDDSSVMVRIGFLFEYGHGVPQSYEKAVEWYTKSAEQGNAYAQNNLGVCLYNGLGVPQSYEKAIEWFIKSAEQENANAQYSLGLCYKYGHGVPQSYDKAVEWYTKSAEQGNASAQNNLGNCLFSGHGIPRSYEKAVEWYKKSADQGDAVAQYNLGLCYKYGDGVTKSHKEAMEWFSKAAKQGYAPAKRFPGVEKEVNSDNKKYSHGDSDLIKADAQHGDSYAQYLMGFNSDLEHKHNESIEWYEKAAEQENVSALVALGNAYLVGRNVPISKEKAITYFLKAAEQGDYYSQLCLGRTYLQIGEFKKGFYWLLKASETDSGESLFEVAKCYEKGLGVYASYDMAIKYYERAIKNKCAHATFRYSDLKRKGRTIDENDSLVFNASENNVNGDAFLKLRYAIRCIHYWSLNAAIKLLNEAIDEKGVYIFFELKKSWFAFKNFETLAINGNSDGQFYYALYYYYYPHIYKKYLKQRKIGIKWMIKSSKKNNIKALRFLQYHFKNERKNRKANYWSKKLSDLENKSE